MATQVRLIRGVAVASQTTPGTAAVIGTNNWLNWCTKASLEDQVAYDTPEVLVYRAWIESQGIALTRVVAWSIEFLMDTWQWAWFLKSFDGTPTGVGPYVFTPGLTAGKLLTLVKVNKNLTTYRKVLDGICSELIVPMLDVTKPVSGSAKGLAVLSEPVSSPPTPAYVVPADGSPLRAWWAVATVNAVATGVESAKLTLAQVVKPFYTTPTVAPTGSTPAGVSPSDWEVSKMNGRLELTTKYAADAASQLYNYRHDVANATNSLSIFDPNATTKGVLITAPVLKAISGKEDDSNPLSRQTTTQAVLYDSGTAGGLTLAVNGDAALADS